MKSIEDHLAHVVSLGTRLPAINTNIDEGIGGVLATDLTALLDVPPFDNSSMDGFAVRAEDVTAGVYLDVIGDIPAGATSAPTVGAGQAARIMTGAPMPAGADSVVPVESTDQPIGAADLPDVIQVDLPVKEGSFVRRRAVNIAKGVSALKAGQPWTPAAAATAASLGYAEVPIIAPPTVAIVTTGSELAAPGEPLDFGQIPDSNSTLAAGLIRQFGGQVHSTQIVSDDPDAFQTALDKALEADIVLSTGGVSVGAFDVVRQVVEGEIAFENVAIQPGKPQASGRLRASDGRSVPFVGLPGNPVSVFVSSWMFLRPLIATMAGASTEWPSFSATAAEGWSCPPNRRQYIPVKISGDEVAPVHAHGSGSHLVASLALADGLAVVAAEVEAVAAGDRVRVHRTTV